MLKLDVLEQRPLNSLESSVSRTVTHGWPVLHVPFIHELKIDSDPISEPGNLDQVALQVNVQKTHYSLTEISENNKCIPESELVSCARKKDTGEQFAVNFAGMLDAVEKGTPMEICDSSENIMLEESSESSDLHMRDDLLEITVAHDLTNQLHMKDGHTLSNPVSKMNDKAAGMEVMGTGAVFQSEQSERVGNLPNDTNTDEYSGLEIPDSVKVLTETGSLAATKTHTSIDESPERFLHDKCLQCTDDDTQDSDSVKCLEVERLPCLQSTSTQKSFDPVDLPKVSTSFRETSIGKEPEFSCIDEVDSATCLLDRLEPNTVDDISAPKENVSRDKDLDMSVDCIQQNNGTASSNEKQNCISFAYLSETVVSAESNTRLQDVTKISNVGLLYDKSTNENDSTSSGNSDDDHSLKPNLLTCFENLTCAKALDTEECSFSSSMSDCSTPLGDGASDCHKYTCAQKLEDSSDPLPHNLCLTPLKSICEEPSYAKATSSSSADCRERSFIDFNTHSGDSELDGETKEQICMSLAASNDRNAGLIEPDSNSQSLSMAREEKQCAIPPTLKLLLSGGTGIHAVAQSQGLCDMVPAVINDPTTSLKFAEDSHCLVGTEDSSCGLSDSNAIIDVNKCDKALISHMQSNVLHTIKETVLTSEYLEVPCRTVDYCTDKTPSYALVPYIDIWGSLSKCEVNSPLSLREPKTVIGKNAESQELKKAQNEFKDSVKEDNHLELPKVSGKDVCMLNAFNNPQEVVELSRCGGKHEDDEPVLDSFTKMSTLLAQEVKCNVSADSFPCHTESHSIKINENVPTIINQSEGVCHFNSGALCESSVALDVNNISVLPQLVEVRLADDLLKGEEINTCFLKEKRAPHLSSAKKHFGDHSAILPAALPASTVALTESKIRKKKHSNLILGNLQSHVINHSGSSVEILHDQSKSLSLKQDAHLGPRHGTTLKKPLKASCSVQCMRISATEVNDPTQSVQPHNENRSPCMLHMEKLFTCVREPSPGKAVVAIKTKATRVRSQRNVFIAEIKIPETAQKERPRQSANCPLEILSSTTGRKKYNLRPAPQSLNCTSQEAKRPKIYNGKDGCPASSGLLNCDVFSQKSESQPSKPCKTKEHPSAIRNGSCVGTSISMKRQANRKCKSWSTPKNLAISSETRTCNSSTVDYKSLSSKHVDLNLISKSHYSKMTRAGNASQKPIHLLNGFQDRMLLNKLSKIANRLTAPSESKTTCSNWKVFPFSDVKCRARKLLNVFSCVKMRMNSQLGQNWQENVCLTSSRDHLVSQSMNLYPTSFSKTCFSSLGDAFSLNACDNLTFPVSFHVNMDPSCLSDFLKFNPPDFILRRPRPTAETSELSEWTLSLFLSSHVPADNEYVHLLTQWNPQFRSLESSSESSHTRKSVRKSGCSMLGLHTVLALSSPGCYRLWTRRRNLGSRIPTVQKLSVMQFAHGLKGSPPQFSRKRDQFSSLAFSLGRVLSTWSRHGLSAVSSDCVNIHPNCSVWLPSQGSNIISVSRSPNKLVCVPQLPLNTVLPYSLPLKPRICHQEDMGHKFCLSTQQKNDSRPLSWLSSKYNNVGELSDYPFKVEASAKQSFSFSTVKEDNLNLPLEPSTRQHNHLERPLGLSSPILDLKPVINNITLQKDQNPTISLDSQCDVSIQEDAVVDVSCPELPPKGQACPFKQRENIIIPCAQGQSEDQVNEKRSFERKPQRVSQIRIRKTIPKPDPNLTPMGLPKPKRVNKKEFSLEDIYTNKNYKSPPPARSLETIFEEPKEKNGVLISVSQQKRKRILEFRDCTVPRLKRPKCKVKVMTSCKRGRKAAMEGVQLDALLIQKLMDLENCLLEEEAMERGSAASVMPS